MSSDLGNAPSASGAAEAAREVGGQATDQVKVVAGEARDQFGRLLGKTHDELRDRAQEQSDRAAGVLRTLAGQVRALSEGRSEEAGPLAGYLSEAQGKVEQFADRLADRGPQGVLEDLAGFARRKPAVFLLLAGGAGFAVGRGHAYRGRRPQGIRRLLLTRQPGNLAGAAVARAANDVGEGVGGVGAAAFCGRGGPVTVESPDAPSTRGDDLDPATQPLRPDASVTELLGELAGQMSTLFRQELELAKVETKDEAKRAGKAMAMFGGAGVAAWIGLLLASMAIAWLLDQGLNTALLDRRRRRRVARRRPHSGPVWLSHSGGRTATAHHHRHPEGGRRMGHSPEALRDEIAGTRQDMSDTLEAIGDHVSPGRIVERRKNRITNSVHQVRERVMGSATDTASSISDATGSLADSARQTPHAVAQRTQGSPLAMGAVAFGLGFVAPATFPATRPEKEATGELLSKAEPLKDELKSVGQDVVDNLKEPPCEAVETVKDTAVSGAEHIKTSAQQAMPTGDRSSERTGNGPPASWTGAPPSTLRRRHSR